MKVLLINGSPHGQGSTYTALKEAAETLEKKALKQKLFKSDIMPYEDALHAVNAGKTENVYLMILLTKFQ